MGTGQRAESVKVEKEEEIKSILKASSVPNTQGD
jgi:hypothetical protein